MNRWRLGLALMLVVGACGDTAGFQGLRSPEEVLGSLFEDSVEAVTGLLGNRNSEEEASEWHSSIWCDDLTRYARWTVGNTDLGKEALREVQKRARADELGNHYVEQEDGPTLAEVFDAGYEYVGPLRARIERTDSGGWQLVLVVCNSG